jgi:hypothetical protein
MDARARVSPTPPTSTNSREHLKGGILAWSDRIDPGQPTH